MPTFRPTIEERLKAAIWSNFNDTIFVKRGLLEEASTEIGLLRAELRQMKEYRAEKAIHDQSIAARGGGWATQSRVSAIDKRLTAIEARLQKYGFPG